MGFSVVPLFSHVQSSTLLFPSPPSYPDRGEPFYNSPWTSCLYACMRYIIQPQLPPTICCGEEGCLLFVHPTLSPVVVVFRLFWSVCVTGLKVFYRPPYTICPHIIAFYYIIIAFKAFNFFLSCLLGGCGRPPAVLRCVITHAPHLYTRLVIG